MNRIELEDNGFPMTAKTIRFLQETSGIAFEHIAKSFGNCILWGVEKYTPAGIYTDGALCYNGEVLPFIGGGTSDYADINASIEDAVYKSGLSKPAYFTRVATNAGEASVIYIAGLKRLDKIITPTYPVNTNWVSPIYAANYSDTATWNLLCRVRGGKGLIVGAYEKIGGLGNPAPPAGTAVRICTLPFKPVREQYIQIHSYTTADWNMPQIAMGRVTAAGELYIDYDVQSRGMAVVNFGVISAAIDLI
jgi:hypothetical protein